MTAPGSSASPTVLVVEDDDRISTVLVKGLRAHGFTPERVTTGAEALDRLAAGSIDVHLLDLGLPDIDGLEVLRILRDRGIHVPAVIVTARTDPRDRAAALELGVHAYLTKPFAWADLVAAIRQCCGLPVEGTERR
jgi:DNA-binding response OmpR family regulator